MQDPVETVARVKSLARMLLLRVHQRCTGLMLAFLTIRSVSRQTMQRIWAFGCRLGVKAEFLGVVGVLSNAEVVERCSTSLLTTQIELCNSGLRNEGVAAQEESRLPRPVGLRVLPRPSRLVCLITGDP